MYAWGCLYAQKSYTLQECIDKSLSLNPDIAIQNLGIRNAENNLEASKWTRWPSLSGSWSQGINGGRSIDPFTNSFIQRTINSNSMGLNGSWNLFNGFSTQSLIQQNGLQTEIARLDLQHSKKNVKIGTIQAFLNVLLATELLNIAVEQKKDLLKQMEVLKQKLKEGLVSQTQINDLDAQLANVNYSEIETRNKLKTEKMRLSNMMGIKNFQDFDIKVSPGIETPIPDDNFLHPLQKISRQRLQIAQISNKMSRFAKYPSVNAGYGLGTAYSSAAANEINYFRQLDFNFNQYLRLGLNIPIFSNGQISQKISKAKIDEIIAKKELEKQDLKINQEWEAYKQELELLTQKLVYSRQNVEIQSKAYTSAAERFNEGLLNITEFNTFRMNLEKAKINLIQNQLEVRFRTLVMNTFAED
jgi:outer membrane protein